MNKTEKHLLDAAINLAVEKEFEQLTDMDVPEMEIPPELDKRIYSTIRKKNFKQFMRDNSRIVAAACLCVMAVGIGVGVPLYVEATENDYYMLTDQDMYRNNISVQFVCREEESTDARVLKPNSAVGVLDGFALVGTYSTDSVYIEEYDGVRYEQTSLHAEGQYILPTKDKNIRNIVIGEYTAVLVFDNGHAAIVWRDEQYSYLLEGAVSSDDAMRYARLISE